VRKKRRLLRDQRRGAMARPQRNPARCIMEHRSIQNNTGGFRPGMRRKVLFPEPEGPKSTVQLAEKLPSTSS
jgi:hypothetical protein